MCGYSYWTADVFGLDGKTTPETHMRYAQWSLLSPVARYFVRPPRIDDTRFPWSHNTQAEANFRKYAELRMKLLPYFNTLAHESYLTGTPIMRPMVMEFQSDERMRGIDDQIMLGEHLMICPVVQAGAASRQITLPEGMWHDYWSGETWQGGQTIHYDALLDCLPLLVRGGTILPMGPVLQNIPPGHQFEAVEFHLWPPYPAEGLFFDDDGETTAYQHGAFTRTRIRAEQQGDRVVVRLSGVQGMFDGQVDKRRIDIILHRSPGVLSASVNGTKTEAQVEPDFVRISFEHEVRRDAIIEIIFLL
jgi:alpha-glucosidase (family GH31 glycosyl hydrolase)